MREMQEFGRVYKPAVIVLVEPRIFGTMADEVCRKLGMDRWVRSEAEGFSGGIWCLWDENEIKVELRHARAYFIHLSVHFARGRRWEMTAVYAPPSSCKRRKFWEKIDEVKIEDPWLTIGDFNCVLQDMERSSNKGASSSFQEWVGRRGLIDLGYVGAAFTWIHGISASTRWAARLDRALCDTYWHGMFPASLIKHLPHSYSDHCPLLLEIEECGVSNLGRRPFRFEQAWTTSPEFEDVIRKEWRKDIALPEALKELCVTGVEYEHIWERV